MPAVPFEAAFLGRGVGGETGICYMNSVTLAKPLAELSKLSKHTGSFS